MNERSVLIDLLILCLKPVLLLLFDNFAARGGSLEAAGIKLTFAQITEAALSSATVPTNIGLSGRKLGDSGSEEILGALSKAAANEMVIVDLEERRAWWETRLLILLTGASGQPECQCICRNSWRTI